MASTLTVAALCAGYGGLELGLGLAGVDVDLVWCAETDPHASAVMAAHYPYAPNLGDITSITDPPPADIVTAGFPCQPVSNAGKRKGIHDERWLIDDVCKIGRRAGAQRIILENVAGIYNANGGDALARVVSALAENGFDARWTSVRASDVGAPHGRLRWFCIADSRRELPFAHAYVSRREEQRGAVPMGQELQTSERGGGGTKWGQYAASIARWEPVVGRPPPNPTDSRQHLNPRFVEWMMGLPDGWVSDVVGSRGSALRCLGNGVVPQQAAYALHLLENMR
jgi:DNA (cytosine-5)-methyltransferase 1